MPNHLFRTIAALALSLALSAVAHAETWRRHSLGDYGFATPEGWQQTANREDELDFESPDGRYTLWARLWFPDEPLLGHDDTVVHGTLTIAGQEALFLHNEFAQERFLQYAFSQKDARAAISVPAYRKERPACRTSGAV